MNLTDRVARRMGKPWPGNDDEGVGAIATKLDHGGSACGPPDRHPNHFTQQETSMDTTYTSRPPLDAPVTPEPGADASTTEQAKEKAQEAAGQAKQQAGSQLRSQVDQRSTEAGHRVSGLASDVRSVSEQLREQGKDQPAKLADQAADRAEQLGGYLKENDAERILGDLEDFGRRQPWVVIGGGIALGLVASRFLKASSSRRYEQRSSMQPVPKTPPAPTAATGFDTVTLTHG